MYRLERHDDENDVIVFVAEVEVVYTTFLFLSFYLLLFSLFLSVCLFSCLFFFLFFFFFLSVFPCLFFVYFSNCLSSSYFLLFFRRNVSCQWHEQIMECPLTDKTVIWAEEWVKSVHVYFFTENHGFTRTYGVAVCSSGRDNSDCRKTFWNSITASSHLYMRVCPSVCPSIH